MVSLRLDSISILRSDISATAMFKFFYAVHIRSNGHNFPMFFYTECGTTKNFGSVTHQY